MLVVPALGRQEVAESEDQCCGLQRLEVLWDLLAVGLASGSMRDPDSSKQDRVIEQDAVVLLPPPRPCTQAPTPAHTCTAHPMRTRTTHTHKTAIKALIAELQQLRQDMLNSLRAGRLSVVLNSSLPSWGLRHTQLTGRKGLPLSGHTLSYGAGG